MEQVINAYQTVPGSPTVCQIGATVYANDAIAGLTRNMDQCLAIVGPTSFPEGVQQPITCTLRAEVRNHRARKWTVEDCPEAVGAQALDVARNWNWQNPYSDRVPYELRLTFDPSSPE